jgi:hypothetical protein
MRAGGARVPPAFFVGSEQARRPQAVEHSNLPFGVPDEFVDILSEYANILAC